jgi:hypothetical protein
MLTDRLYNKRHPRELGVPEMQAYLSHLAVDRPVGVTSEFGKICTLKRSCSFGTQHYCASALSF